MTEILRILSERNIGIKELGLKAELVSELVELFSNDIISSRIAKDIFPEILEKSISPKQIIERDGLAQVSDTTQIEKIVEKLIADNQESVEKYRSGKTNILGFFVGQTMKETNGKANPKIITDVVKKYLEG